MTRIMLDSTSAQDIPADAQMVAGYMDGADAWSAADWQRFAHAVRVRISVNAFGPQAEVLDIEQGDATPVQSAGWVSRQHSLGVQVPTLYCNRGNEGAVDAALHAADIPPANCAFWVATLDGTEVRGTTEHGYPIVACQTKGQNLTGGHYDESVIYDDNWPGAVTPLPDDVQHGTPTPGFRASTTSEDGPMAYAVTPTTSVFLGIDAQGRITWSEHADGVQGMVNTGPEPLPDQLPEGVQPVAVGLAWNDHLGILEAWAEDTTGARWVQYQRPGNPWSGWANLSERNPAWSGRPAGAPAATG